MRELKEGCFYRERLQRISGRSPKLFADIRKRKRGVEAAAERQQLKEKGYSVFKDGSEELVGSRQGGAGRQSYRDSCGITAVVLL